MDKINNDMMKNNSKRRHMFRKKVCVFCKEGIYSVDYKDVSFLQRFIMPVGKILPRRITGTCAKHQRMVSQAIKKARMAALLPYKNVD